MTTATPMRDTNAAGGHGPRWFTGFLVLAVVVLGALCLVLARENRQLKSELAVRASPRSGTEIKEGERLAGLTLVRRDGSVRELAFSEGDGAGPGPALVLVMGAGCGYCDEVIPVWDRVLTELGLVGEEGGGLVRIAAVQTDATNPSAMKEMPASIPVHMAPEPRGTWLVRVHVEPSAVLLDGRGVVLRAWLGLPGAADAEGLRSALLEAAGAGK